MPTLLHMAEVLFNPTARNPQSPGQEKSRIQVVYFKYMRSYQMEEKFDLICAVLACEIMTDLGGVKIRLSAQDKEETSNE